MLAQLDQSLQFLKDLEKSHQTVATKTGELHQVTNCVDTFTHACAGAGVRVLF